ncbi:hypothetical protein GCM10010464_39270 [Pseudonocardia yunnanensis]
MIVRSTLWRPLTINSCRRSRLTNLVNANIVSANNVSRGMRDRLVDELRAQVPLGPLAEGETSSACWAPTWSKSVPIATAVPPVEIHPPGIDDRSPLPRR